MNWICNLTVSCLYMQMLAINTCIYHSKLHYLLIWECHLVAALLQIYTKIVNITNGFYYFTNQFWPIQVLAGIYSDLLFSPRWVGRFIIWHWLRRMKSCKYLASYAAVQLNYNGIVFTWLNATPLMVAAFYSTHRVYYNYGHKQSPWLNSVSFIWVSSSHANSFL